MSPKDSHAQLALKQNHNASEEAVLHFTDTQTSIQSRPTGSIREYGRDHSNLETPETIASHTSFP